MNHLPNKIRGPTRRFSCLIASVLIQINSSADNTNNAVLIQPSPQAKIPFSHEYGDRELENTTPAAIEGLFENRILHEVTNTFAPTWDITYLQNEASLRAQGVTFDQYYTSAGKNAVTAAARLTIRELALKIFPGAMDRFETLESVFEDSFSGYEEHLNLASPFHPQEGLPGQDGIRKETGFKWGVRPWSTSSPYAFMSYGFRDASADQIFALNLRYYYDDWRHGVAELIGEVPLSRNWGLGLGAKMYPRDYFESDNPYYQKVLVAETLGIYGHFGNGFLGFGGAVYPYQSITLSYNYQF